MNVEHCTLFCLHFGFVQYKCSKYERNGIFTFNFPCFVRFRSIPFRCWLFYFNNFISHFSVFHLIQSSYKQPNQARDALECLALCFILFHFVYDDRGPENQEKPLFTLVICLWNEPKKKNNIK